MNWAMPCARSPLLVRGPTTPGWKRLSCQITRAKNSSGRFCARAADSIMRQRDSRTSTFPARAGGGGAAGGASVVSDGAVAGGGDSVISDGAAAGGDFASLPAAGGALLSAGAAGALVSAPCPSAGAAANSISAIIAMRAMRDNGETGVIVAREHTSARQPREARRARPARHGPRKSGSCVPSPVYGGGTGRGHAKRQSVRATPSPPLPRKRGREQTAQAERDGE